MNLKAEKCCCHQIAISKCIVIYFSVINPMILWIGHLKVWNFILPHLKHTVIFSYGKEVTCYVWFSGECLYCDSWFSKNQVQMPVCCHHLLGKAILFHHKLSSHMIPRYELIVLPSWWELLKMLNCSNCRHGLTLWHHIFKTKLLLGVWLFFKIIYTLFLCNF